MSSKNRTLLFSVTAAVAVVGFVWYYFHNKKTKSIGSTASNTAKASANSQRSNQANSKIVAEDVEEDDDDDEEEEEEEGEDEEGDDEDDADEEGEEEEGDNGAEEEREDKSQPSNENGSVPESSSQSAEELAAEQERARAEADEKKRIEDEMKVKYDDAVRMAKKLFQGNSFVKAAEKYKEAINLANYIPSAQKDLVVLYNNSSAMYEKAGMYSDALIDASVVLSLDSRHIKARIRRGRVYEATNQKLEALDDFVCSMMLEQQQQQMRPDGSAPNQSCLEDIDRLNKELAAIEASKRSHKFTACTNADEKPFPLPNKAHARSFLESFPSYYQAKTEFALADRSELSSALQHAYSAIAGDPAPTLEALTVAASALVALLRCDLSAARLSKVEETLDNPSTKALFDTAEAKVIELSAAQVTEGLDSTDAVSSSSVASSDVPESSPGSSSAVDKTTVFKSLISYMVDVKGLIANVHGNYRSAEQFYAHAATLDASCFEPSLRRAQVMIDIGKAEEAEKMYDILVSSVSACPESPRQHRDLAWILAHRSYVWTVRNDKGQYKADTMSKCLNDLAAALEHCDKAEAGGMTGDDVKGARFAILLKKQYAISHTKAQVTASVPGEEDKQMMAAIVQEAKALFPNHPSISLLEADIMSQEGQTSIPGAMEKVDSSLESAEDDSATPYLVKASLLTQQAFVSADIQSFQQVMREVEELYTKAIETEPTCIEAYVNFAQMKNFTGDVTNALALLEKAIPFARSREDLLEACQLLIMSRAQAKAVTELRGL